MIKLFRTVDCSLGADFQDALQDMVIAHEVIVVDRDQVLAVLPPETPLPALSDNGRLITGRAEIEEHLKQLEQFVADWRRFQSDACYINEDGEIC